MWKNSGIGLLSARVNELSISRMANSSASVASRGRYSNRGKTPGNWANFAGFASGARKASRKLLLLERAEGEGESLRGRERERERGKGKRERNDLECCREL